MKTKVSAFISFIILILSTSCGNRTTTGSSSKNDTTKTDTSNYSSKTVPVDFTNMLMSIGRMHSFSDTAQKDSFNLTMYGTSVLAGNIIFKITDFNKAVIFRDTFGAWGLLYDQADVIESDIAKQDTIIKRFLTYFEDDKFSFPAIDPSDTFDNGNLSDENDWDVIKKDSTAIGFYYAHGYEGSCEIAFSKKKKTVVDYWASD